MCTLNSLSYSQTALHLAVEKNQHLMASDLISLGANINEQDSLGKTPLHLCAENGYLRVLEVSRSLSRDSVLLYAHINRLYSCILEESCECPPPNSCLSVHENWCWCDMVTLPPAMKWSPSDSLFWCIVAVPKPELTPTLCLYFRFWETTRQGACKWKWTHLIIMVRDAALAMSEGSRFWL